MSLLWMLGVGTTPTAPVEPTTPDNAPSLWSGGVAWGDPAAPFGDGTDGYWASPDVPVRSGFPRLAVAIGGVLVLNQLQRATWSLGRPDWMSTLTPTSASFEFVDVPVAAVNDSIVVALMSDTEAYHSDALWVGRVDDVTVRRDLDDHVFASISATDVIGVLGQAKAPASLAAGYTLKTLTERLAADAGLPIAVDADALVTLPPLLAAASISGTTLDLINRAERSSNALLFMRGNGRLFAAMRQSTGATSVRVITLDGRETPSGWTEQTSLGNVITRWELGNETWRTDTSATTLEDYGDRAFSATDLLVNDPSPYANLIGSDVMAHPRAIVIDAPFPISDMAQEVLGLDPLDRVVMDGTTWQVMSVQHEVSPVELVEADGSLRTRTEWRMSITADATQEALAGAPDPGPVEPPKLDTVSQTYVSTKAGTSILESDGDKTGTSLGDINVGKFLDGSRRRGHVEWAVVAPTNAIRVLSAKVRLTTASATEDGRISVRAATDSWTEGTVDWPGPHTTTIGERFVNVPSSAGRRVELSITRIAQWWHDHENDGIRIASVNEDSTLRRAVFYSDDSSDVDTRPTLYITWEVVS